MYWAAGQKRLGREARERLAELYVGVRDGYVAGLVASGQAKARGDSHVPGYAKPDPGATKPRGLAELVADFPGAVSNRSEFRN